MDKSPLFPVNRSEKTLILMISRTCQSFGTQFSHPPKLFLLFVILSLFSCSNNEKPPNKITPSPSPNEEYWVHVSVIEEETQGFQYWWQVEVQDEEGNILLLDKDSFPARFHIYWLWDEENRLWVYNSDDGKIYFYFHDQAYVDSWQKMDYFLDSYPEILSYPDGLVPQY